MKGRVGRPGRQRIADNGIALVAVLMVTSLIAALAAAVVFIAMSGSLASANHAAGQQALYAADAAVEEILSELRAADWAAAPGAFASTRLADASPAPRAPDGTPVDLSRLTGALQAESDARYGLGPDHPVWRLAGRGAFRDLLPGLIVPPAYLVVWVADDGAERDGDPGHDSNRLVVVRADAFGSAAAHRSIEAALMLELSASPLRHEVRIASWREVR